MFERSLTRTPGRAKSRSRVGPTLRLLGRLLGFLLGLLSLWGGPAEAEPLVIEARPVALDPEDPKRRRVGDLVYLGGLELTSPDHRFGGLSGLAIAADGARMLAISDRGQWVGARLIHDAQGALVGVGEAEIAPLGDRNGDPLSGRLGDAEDIASLAGGGYAVSFERYHRIAIYPGDPFSPGNNRGALLTPPPALIEAPGNKGVEALTEIEPGRLLAVTEGLFSGVDRLQGWLFSAPGTAAEPATLSYATPSYATPSYATLSYAPLGEMRPTALARIPGGDVLALERAYSLVGGFRVRLVRIASAAVVPGAALRAVEIARFDASLTVDNFEGLAVRRDDRGRLLVYMISDDNFSGFQRTLLMQFHLVY